jgi:dihydroflavonol-4-reductase
VVGTKNILAAARAEGVRCLVHTSTIGTIGRPPDGSLPTEDTPFNLWETSSPYARSKYLAEVAALEAAADLRVIVVNPTAPIGPRDWKPSSSGQRVVDALKGRIPSFLPGGINHVAVQDVALGHLLAAERGQPGRRYILGNQNLSLEDFLSLVEQASGQRVPRPGWRLPFPRPQPTQGKGRPWGLVCDCSRSVRELGLPQTPLLIAFHEAVQWFRGHGYVQRR